jgi:CHAT domain-containing protein
LFNVEAEVEHISHLALEASARILDRIASPCAVADVVNKLPRANIVHLACHGVQDEIDSLESGFCLSDDKLTISRLMDLKLTNASLAFLSACETARGDKWWPDQTIHLAAALLFAGFRSVIATMW